MRFFVLLTVVEMMLCAPFVRGQATCNAGQADAFMPFDVSNATTEYISSNGVDTHFVPSLYGPDQAPGSNNESEVAGGATHLADGQALASGNALAGGGNGMTPLCSDGSQPSGGVCRDKSTPTIAVVLLSMSIGHRYYNSSLTENFNAPLNAFLNHRDKESFLDFVTTPADRIDFNGMPADTNLALNPHLTFVDCGQEGHNLADTATNVSWGGNLNWNDSATPSPWWVCVNYRIPNFSVSGNNKQAVTPQQVQAVELVLTIGLGQSGPGAYTTILPLSNLNGGACTPANIDGGSGPTIFPCDVAYYLGQVLRNLKAGFPNIQMAFIDSMFYEGYTRAMTQPPPCDYEQGFGVKKVIEAQIQQAEMGGAVQDPLVGDLCYKAPCPNGEPPVAPYVDWGVYSWAQGVNVPNKAGATWDQGDGSGHCPARSTADYNTTDGCLHESTTGTGPAQTMSLPDGQSTWARLGWLMYKNNASTATGNGLTAFFMTVSAPQVATRNRATN